MNETSEQKRSRLRWLTLAEIVAIVAVAISALGLWKSWRDEPARPAVVVAGARSVPLTLRAVPDKDHGALSLAAVEAGHAVQSATISYPSALDVGPSEQTGEIRLSASTLDNRLFRARDDAKAAKETKGGSRLPILVVTRYVEAGAPREDRAIYDLGYSIRDGGLLSGRELRLGGVSLAVRGKAATQAALDRRWSRQLP